MQIRFYPIQVNDRYMMNMEAWGFILLSSLETRYCNLLLSLPCLLCDSLPWKSLNGTTTFLFFYLIFQSKLLLTLQSCKDYSSTVVISMSIRELWPDFEVMFL